MKKARKRGRRTNAEKAKARKIGLVIFLLSLFSFTSLGFIGRVATNLFRFFVGDFYMPMSLIGIVIGLYMIVKTQGLPLNSKKTLGLIASMVGVLLFMHAYFFGPIINPELNPIVATWRFYYTDLMQNSVAQSLGGGMVGALLYAVTHFLVAQIGTYVVSVLLIVWGIVLFFSLPMKAILTKVKEYLLSVGGWIKAKWQTSVENRQAKKKDKVQKSKEKQDKKQPVDIQSSGVKSETDDLSQPVLEIDHFQKRQSTIGDEVDSSVLSKDETQATGKSAANIAPELEDDGKDVDFEITSEEENDEYKLPPITLLNKSKVVDQSNEYDLIQKNVKKLEETFESFGVNAKVTKANLGPAVTKYEIQPATGVKVSKIVSLSDDIALALAAKDIRMEAPIPGKALIGIEVPNQDVSMVSFKEIIEGQENNPDKLLEVPLGRDISGAVAMADLSKMPHVLVAGATGSGKSVSINTMITSLLMKAKPHQVKLMMIDPKMVELSVYNGIPHLLTPVVTNPRKAAQALQKVVQEMERRYELFAASGTRNITGYNLHVKEKNQSKEEALKTLPFIVVIVDELADLMMVASNEVEDAIIRLAQMARAAGIHMILATQRPSVDVITGIIKANVPSRIAFAVSSGTDSRTILDGNGAEKLLGRGDMLFQPMGQNKPTRVQGAFISDEEVEAVVNFVKTQQEANYVEEMIPTDQPDTNTAEPEDELFEDAVDLIVDMQTASISMLQRRFRIGYNRAARMIDEMELRGIVGPHEGSKPRVVNMQKQPEENDLNE